MFARATSTAKLLTLAALLLSFLIVPSANALTSTIFTPSPSDLNDLTHQKYYRWGIDYDGDTPIVEAVLRIKDIRDWIYEPGDSLYMHLLDWAPLGVSIGTDNQGGGDQFAGTPYIGTFTDPFGDWAHRQTVEYSFSSLGLLDELNAYVNNDGRFALAFDADCHYYNSGVEFEVTTGVVPEPTTMMLLGLGLLGTAAYRKVRS